MKQITLLLVSLALVSCNSLSEKETKTVNNEILSLNDSINSPLTANSKAEEVQMPLIEMLETSFNFGELQQGESVTHDFVLKNTGEAALIIVDAKGSCGCTVPEWPRGPIIQGEEVTIKVTFNSSGKKGKQNKTVTLVTNAIPNTKVLTIIGNIIVPQKK